MKLGQHYIYKDRLGRDQESIWIESALDLQRYFDENVYCIDSGFCLSKNRNFPKLWKTVDSRIQKLLNVSDNIRLNILYIKAEKSCRIDPDLAEFIIPSEYRGDYAVYTEEDEENTYAGGLPTIEEINQEYYNLTPNGRTMNALLDHLNNNAPDINDERADMSDYYSEDQRWGVN